MILAPRYPLLSCALWVASLSVYVRGACHLTVTLARGRPLGRVLGWYAAASGLVSATAFSVGWWQAGALFAVMGAGCGVLWVRERRSKGECR
jgi:hypothetical protein